MASFGPNWDIINVAIDAGATPTEVTYVRSVRSFTVWARDQRAFEVRRLVGDTKLANMFDGERFDSKIMLSDANFAGSSLCFIRFTDGAAGTIEGIVTY